MGRVDLHLKGFRQLRTAPKVMAFLDERARAIKDAAGDGFEMHSATEGKNRGRAQVYTDTIKAKRAEAKDRRLTRAIDSGRT